MTKQRRHYFGRQLYWHRWGKTYLHINFDRRKWLIGCDWSREIGQAGDEFGLTIRPLPTIEILFVRLYGWPHHDWEVTE